MAEILRLKDYIKKPLPTFAKPKPDDEKIEDILRRVRDSYWIRSLLCQIDKKEGEKTIIKKMINADLGIHYTITIKIDG